MFSLSLAYDSLLLLLLGLTLSFLLLLGYTFWSRAKKQYWNRYRSKFRDYYFPILFSFVEDDRGQEEVDIVIKKVSKQTKEIVFFLEMLREMTELLEGKERERLNLLVEHDLFFQFYRKKLFSFFKNDQLLAFVYFEKSGVINDRISARLTKLSKSSNIKVAFGATKALQSSDNVVVRRNALIRFLKRNDASDLMVSEVLHLFYRGDLQEHKKMGKALKDILLHDNISPRKKKIIVLYIGNQHFHEYGEFLHQYLKKIQYGPEKVHLIIGLITALGNLHVYSAAPTIREYAKISNVDLRLTCVEALSTLGGEKNYTYLTSLLLHIEFSVRKAILRTLAKNPDLGHKLLNQFILSNSKFINQFREMADPPDDLRNVVMKIKSIAMGIKIMLSQKSKAGKV